MMAQNEVFAFLENPASHCGVPVRRIDTHAASVFLAGDRAFKIKRAINLGFLDYSSLAQRKAACEAEMAVNHPYAPQIYRGIVAITRAPDGQLSIGGDGEPVEYAVEMRRFDETQTLDHLPPGAIDDALGQALGDAVASAHAQSRRTDGAAWVRLVRTIITDNARDLHAAVAATPGLDASAIDALTETSLAQLDRLTPLLLARAQQGYVRRGHGDLHLGNIVRIDGAPVLFDALEFDDALASGDALYDLAFLLMDLWNRGHQRAANGVLNRYLTHWPDAVMLDGLAALPLFLSMRAAIRAKVTLLRGARTHAPMTEAVRSEAVGYVRLAADLIAPAPARAVAIGGLSGTGKSHLARALAPEIGPAPGAVIMRSDVLRKQRFGKAETDRLPPGAYAPAETSAVYEALAARVWRIAATGHGVVADAVFARPDERALVTDAARAAGASFAGLMLQADLDTRLARVGSRTGDASDADQEVARQQEAYDLGACDWPRVDASGSANDTAANARTALAAATRSER